MELDSMGSLLNFDKMKEHYESTLKKVNGKPLKNNHVVVTRRFQESLSLEVLPRRRSPPLERIRTRSRGANAVP